MRVLTLLVRTNWRMVGAALFAIGILHILATFTAPRLATAPAYARLSAKLPVNTMVVLPPLAPRAQPLPFLPADGRYAMCRFDTSNGPVSVTASLPGPGWTLAVYSKDGENLHAVVARPGRATDVSLQLLASDDRFVGLSPLASGRAGLESTALPVAARQGIIVIRSPDQGSVLAPINESALRKVVCAARAS